MTVESRAVERLVEQMNAQVLVQVEEYVPRGIKAYATGVFDAEDQVRACVRCHLGARGRQMALEVSVQTRAKFAVVGECPDAWSERAGRVGAGKGVSEIRKMTTKAGLLRGEVAWINAVSCACEPRVGMVELTACRGNLLAQVEASDVRYVLLVGAHACLEWRTDLGVAELEGTLGIWRGKWIVMAVREYGAVHRVDKGSGVVSDEWRANVYRFIDAAVEDVGINGLGWGCMKRGCVDAMFGYDFDGLSWCRKHLAVGMKGCNASKRRWMPKGIEGQGELL